MGARFTCHSEDLSSAAAIEAAVADRFPSARVPARPPDGHIDTGTAVYRRFGHILDFDGRAFRVTDHDGRPAVHMATHLFGRLAVVA